MPTGIYERTEAHSKAWKGRVAWNKGLTKETDDRVAKYGIATSKGSKGKIPWNKDLTKETDERVVEGGKKTGLSLKGKCGELSSRFGKLKNGGDSNYHAREMKKIYTECVLCRSPEILEMHHKDKDRKNNERSNRVILCVNCHIFWHKGIYKI